VRSKPKPENPMADRVTDDIREAVKAKMGEDGRVTCPVLRKLAEDKGVPYKVVGAAADELDAKVGNCDLGCF
jgi:hypothetical protein